MDGSSRASLAGCRERLEQLGRDADPDQLSAASAQLFSATGLLRAQSTLRRALSDPGLPGRAKTQVVDALFADQVNTLALEVLHALVQARWSSPGDLADAVDALGVSAALLVAERADELDEVEDQLFRFARIIGREARLRAAITDPRVPAERRVELVDDLLARRASPVTVHLVQQVVRHGGRPAIDDALDELSRQAAARRDRLVARVRSAVPLDEREANQLAEQLSRLYDRRVDLRTEVDPAVLGGVVVRVGDEVIDGSVASRLAEARRRLGRSR
jgi:F-type H+-transporting ATPase subunit delta